MLSRLRKRVHVRRLGVGIGAPQVGGLLLLLVLLLIRGALPLLLLALLLLILLVHLLLLPHLLLLAVLLRPLRLLLLAALALLLAALLLVGLLQGQRSGGDDVDLAAVALLAGGMGRNGVGGAGNRGVLVGVGQVLRHVLGRAPSLVPEVVIHLEHGPIVHFRHGYLQRRQRRRPQVQGGVLLYLEGIL